MTENTLVQAVSSLVENYSIEVTPHGGARLDDITSVLPQDTEVYVAHPPGQDIGQVVSMAVRLKQAGFTPVPHLVARKVADAESLERALADLREHGIDHALVIAGDEAVPGNIFDSSLELLESGLPARYDFKRIGVAGHPEGSKAIGPERVEQALRDKAAFARGAPYAMHFVTQFGFNPEAVAEWEAHIRAAGIDLPIHVGLPGPASLRQLTRFAVMCGLGNSAKMMAKHAGAAMNLLKTQAPDDQITYLAQHRLRRSDSCLAKVHFFAFGGVVNTAQWANRVAEGRFTLNPEATGFEVMEDQ